MMNKTRICSSIKIILSPKVGVALFAVLLICSAASQNREKSKIRWGEPFSFSGYDWQAKATTRGRVGPGPNLYSSDRDNVWIDDAGHLHLRTTYKKNRWWCAEIASIESFGYGTYKFHLEKVPDELNEQVVLGLFTWDDDPDQYYREIDIEVSNWGDPARDNTQFVVQPHGAPNHKSSFDSPLTESPLIYSFNWTKTKISFQAIDATLFNQAEDSIVHEWVYSGQPIPSPANENARVCLWLYQGKPPTDRREVEVILSRFEFIPTPL